MLKSNIIKHSRGLAFKMIFFIFSSLAVIFIVIFLYNYKVTKDIVIENLRSNAKNLTNSTVSKIDKVLSSIQKIPDDYAPIFIQNNYSEDQIKSLFRMMVTENKDIFGGGIFFEPYYRDKHKKYDGIYFYHTKDGVAFSELGSDQYDYFTMDWYMIPRELKRPVWSEPYFDTGGANQILTTYSYPCYAIKNHNKEFMGILTVDVSLNWLEDIMTGIKVYKTGYGFIVSQNGTIVTHPIRDFIMNETTFSISDEIKSPELRKIGRSQIRGETNFAEIGYHNIRTGQASWIAYAPIPLNKWSIAIIFPVNEFMADVYKLNRMVIVLGLGGLIIIFIVIILISRSITRPLRRLTLASEKFASGDFNVVLPSIHSKDEIGRLNDSFIYMQNTLASTIQDLQDTSGQLRVSNEKLEEYSQNLEQKVEERTADLKAAQAQLVQSEKLASLGQLTAGIAHEIKNPLNFVNNFAELSVEISKELSEETDKLTGKMDPREADYLKGLITDLGNNAKKINEHGKRADSIVRGMLLHSRGKTGEKQPTDINTILNEYLNLGYHGMRATDNTFNIKIESDYDQGIGMINVVPQDISRVFLNIINNACYSTAQKKKELKDAYFPLLQVSSKDKEDRVEIKIRDNGKGIPKTILDKIFNPFFTTKPAGSGTGLGLSLSYDIVVNEHKGEIKVDSVEGEFAEFTIIIPKNET